MESPKKKKKRISTEGLSEEEIDLLFGSEEEELI